MKNYRDMIAAVFDHSARLQAEQIMLEQDTVEWKAAGLDLAVIAQLDLALTNLSNARRRLTDAQTILTNLGNYRRAL